MINAEATVISGYVRCPHWRARAGEMLDKEAFTGGYRTLWILCTRLAGRLSLQTLHDTVHRNFGDDEAGRLVKDALEHVEASEPVLADWGYAFGRLLKGARARVVEDALRDSATALADNQDLAENVLRTVGPRLDKYSGARRASLQDARAEARLTLERSYAGPRLKVGLSWLDDIMRGFRRGQFVLWGGFAEEGKTSFAVYCAHAFAAQKANVLYVTLEMDKKQIEDLFLTVHSHQVAKRVVDDKEVTGVPYQWFDDAELRETLSVENLKMVRDTIDSFEAKEGVGSIHIWHPSDRITMGNVAEMHSWMRDSLGEPVDVVVVDYLEILDPIRAYGSLQREIRDTMIAAKRFAHEADGGTGVLLWTPWQIRRDGLDEARKKEYYSKWNFAESSYAERQSDVMGWNMFVEGAGRGLMKQGLCKNRTTRRTTMGWPERGVMIACDGDTCLFSDKEAGRFEGSEPELD